MPTKDVCPQCGKTMFKRSGRGPLKAFCINEECPAFVPEDKRRYPKRKTDESPMDEEKSEGEPAGKTTKAAKTASAKAGKTTATKTAKATKTTTAKSTKASSAKTTKSAAAKTKTAKTAKAASARTAKTAKTAAKKTGK